MELLIFGEVFSALSGKTFCKLVQAAAYIVRRQKITKEEDML